MIPSVPGDLNGTNEYIAHFTLSKVTIRSANARSARTSRQSEDIRSIQNLPKIVHNGQRSLNTTKNLLKIVRALQIVLNLKKMFKITRSI